MAAADDRINADPLADGFVGNPFSDGVDNAKNSWPITRGYLANGLWPR
jgi:hypothetical protein